jgi:hypothetical protein
MMQSLPAMARVEEVLPANEIQELAVEKKVQPLSEQSYDVKAHHGEAKNGDLA